MYQDLKFKIEERDREYTGRELRPHFLLTQMGLEGSGLGVFFGPCFVATGELVDYEDSLAGDHIKAARMLHVIGEFFGLSLHQGVLIQRLSMAIFAEILRDRGVVVSRRGDDLFIDERKYSVSIVTASPVSVLLHIGINVDASGAPVAAGGLKDLTAPGISTGNGVVINEREFAREWCERLSREWASIAHAVTKVRPVI